MGKSGILLVLRFPFILATTSQLLQLKTFIIMVLVEWETCIRGILYVKNVWIRDTCYTLIMHYVFRVWEKYHAAHQFWVSEATPFDTLHDENVKRKLVVWYATFNNCKYVACIASIQTNPTQYKMYPIILQMYVFVFLGL